MTGYTWPSDDDVSSTNRVRAWSETVRRLPLGARVSGRVVGRQPFGVFVNIDGVSEALGLAEITALPVGMELPGLAAWVTGEVIGHAEHNHQVRLRLLEDSA